MRRKELKHEEHDVFVVRRPVEPDSTIAEQLLKRLADFRLPRGVRKDLSEDSRRIGSITLDRDDNPDRDTVSEKEALSIREAEWMAVICTPRLPLSRECIAQIDLFKELHGSDHILTILADGDPTVSFPATLRRAIRKEINDKGETVLVEREIEPLAAEARAENGRKRNAMLDDAVLRMAAPMFGLNYDDLKQRRREKLVRVLIRISIAASCAFLAAGLTLLGLASRVKDQNQLIAGQTEALREQYAEAQVKNAESTSLVANQLLRQGDRPAAVSSLLGVLPSSDSDAALPYVSSAVKELTGALGIYDVHCFIPEGQVVLSDAEWEELKRPADYSSISTEAPVFPYTDFDVTYYGTRISLPSMDWNPLLLSGDYDCTTFNWSFLSVYVSSHSIIYCSPVLVGAIVVGQDGALYHFLPGQSSIIDFSLNLYQTPPEGVFTDAAFREEDRSLYLKRSDGRIIRYRWKDETDFENAREEDLKLAGPADDMQFRTELEEGRCIKIYGPDRQEPVSILYGNYFETGTLMPLPDTEYHILSFYPAGAYLLDRNMEIVGRIELYEGYDPERKLIVKRCFNRLTDKMMVLLPLRSYSDLIREAEEYLNGNE